MPAQNSSTELIHLTAETPASPTKQGQQRLLAAATKAGNHQQNRRCDSQHEPGFKVIARADAAGLLGLSNRAFCGLKYRAQFSTVST